MAFNITSSMSVQTDMYIGGAGIAVAGDLADRAPSIGPLAKYNVTNGEAVYAADILTTLFLRKKLRGRMAGIADAAVAGSTFALVDRFMKGKYTATSGAGSSSDTGWEVSDPALGQHWDGAVGAPVAEPMSAGSYGDESPSGFGVD